MLAASLSLAASGFISRAQALKLPMLGGNAPLRLTLGFLFGGAVGTVARTACRLY
jgi:hypothetical protein